MTEIPNEPFRAHDLARGIYWFGSADEKGERDCRPGPDRELIRVVVAELEEPSGDGHGRLVYREAGSPWTHQLRALDQSLARGAPDPRLLTEEGLRWRNREKEPISITREPGSPRRTALPPSA